VRPEGLRYGCLAAGPGLAYHQQTITGNGVPERAEFNAIVDRFAERVYNHALRMLNNREDAEEAMQDVFLRVHRSFGTFRGDAEFSTWLWRITVNVCLSRRGSRWKRRERIQVERISDDIPDDAPGPDELLSRREERRRIAVLIARLPGREAAALTLYYMEELDYATIGRILRIPPGSVATALHRGRERLGKMLRAERE